jgi:hypothetical protein
MRWLSCFSLLVAPPLIAGDLPASTQGKEASGLVNPSSRYQVVNGWNIFFDTEFLWWTAKEDGLYYAQQGYTDPDFSGHLAKVHPHFRPGFRLGLGGNMEYDEWDVFTNWTWFESTARGSKEGDLLTLWSHPDGDSSASFASGKWHLLLNLVDFELGRSFWVGRHFSLRPFLCVRGAFIDQNLRIHYALADSSSHLKARSDFSGGGVRAGSDLRFTLLGGWSFYGLASASMLYGFYDCKFYQDVAGERIATTKDGFRQATSNAQLELGLRWDVYLHRDRYHLGLYAGWEENIWFGLNKMNHFFGDIDAGNLEQMNGDLTLSGGTFGVRFDF